jgi:hypothetical protein
VILLEHLSHDQVMLFGRTNGSFQR